MTTKMGACAETVRPDGSDKRNYLVGFHPETPDVKLLVSDSEKMHCG